MEKVTCDLTPRQTREIKRLYDNQTVQTNGGSMFGLLGQAFIDPEQTAGKFGTAEFYWLNQAQYKHVKRAIAQAGRFELASDAPLSDERLQQVQEIGERLNAGEFEAVNAQGAIMTLLAAFEEALALLENGNM